MFFLDWFGLPGDHNMLCRCFSELFRRQTPVKVIAHPNRLVRTDMRFLAIVCPPLAVLLCGKPVQALLNVLLTVCVWVPGAIHAWGVVTDKQARQNQSQLVNAIQSNNT